MREIYLRSAIRYRETERSLVTARWKKVSRDFMRYSALGWLGTFPGRVGYVGRLRRRAMEPRIIELTEVTRRALSLVEKVTEATAPRVKPRGFFCACGWGESCRYGDCCYILLRYRPCIRRVWSSLTAGINSYHHES